jgi:hypothetical protein
MRKKEGTQQKSGAKGRVAASGKKVWEEPKLAFVEPKLTKHGSLEKVTRGKRRNGFFGEFSP